MNAEVTMLTVRNPQNHQEQRQNCRSQQTTTQPTCNAQKYVV